MSDDFSVEYLVELNPNQTNSAFYCWSGGWETLAIVTTDKRKFHVGSNGEMRIDAPDGGVWRYTSDLISAGIDTDDKLADLEEKHPNMYINNNWFEFYEPNAGNEWWEVHDTIECAIQAIKDIVTEEREGDN